MEQLVRLGPHITTEEHETTKTPLVMKQRSHMKPQHPHRCQRIDSFAVAQILTSLENMLLSRPPILTAQPCTMPKVPFTEPWAQGIQ